MLMVINTVEIGRTIEQTGMECMSKITELVTKGPGETTTSMVREKKFVRPSF
jgi:hypothetical protein